MKDKDKPGKREKLCIANIKIFSKPPKTAIDHADLYKDLVRFCVLSEKIMLTNRRFLIDSES
jgi:hypothetical protein